ncbi:hypothetical protein HN51_046129 [Arachis hypogaea]
MQSLTHAKLLQQQVTLQGFLHHFTHHFIATYIALSSTIRAPHPPSPIVALYFLAGSTYKALPSSRSRDLHGAVALYYKMKDHGWTPDHYAFFFVFK